MCRLAEREGLTRAFGPRPAGDACASSKIAFGDFVEPPFPYLGFESPLRGCNSNLNDNVENLRAVWRRGRDYSALRASPFGPPGRALSPLRRRRSNLNENAENLRSDWRRGRDSNPRWAFDPYALSRGAPSTTRPPLRTGTCPFAERRMIPVRSSPGKAKGVRTLPVVKRRQQSWRRRQIGDLDPLRA